MAIKNIFKKKQWKADYEAGREAYHAGQFQPAEAHLRQALVKALDLDDAAYGDTALLLGQVLRRLERYAESLELTEKSFAYYSGLFGNTDQRTVSAHLSLVLADPQKSHEDGALRQTTYSKAVEQFGPKSWQAVRVAALALSHFGSSEREKALGQAQDALAHALGEGRQELGAWPPVAEEFALELSRLGYIDLASRFMASQLRIYEERYGDKSEQASLSRLALGELFLRCGEWRKAETALTKALEQIKLKQGPKSELARRATVSLGQALARQGRLEQAAPYLTESLETLRGDQGTERLEALVWLLEYKCMICASDTERGALWRELEMAWESHSTEEARGRIFQGFRAAQRRLQEAWELGAAERFLQAVLNRVRNWRGPHHPDVALCMMDLGQCAALRDDDSKAKSYIEQSLALDDGVDNLIRAVALYGELGEREQALRHSQMAARLMKSYSPGLEQGRRQAQFAGALLKAGLVEEAIEHGRLALELLTENEQDGVLLTMAECDVLGGRWKQAEQAYQNCLSRLTEPVGRAKAYLQFAYLLCATGRTTEMEEALAEVLTLSTLRKEHPILIGARAVASQGAFYSGNIYQGKDERDVVFDFLRKGHHQQTRRALSILTLLEPFGPEEYETELDVGTQILAASRFPEAVCTIFPTKDVACMGLRHLTRALFFHGQEDLAQERLSQYRERFSGAYSGLSNPLASSLYLCQALIAASAEEKIEALESARSGLFLLSDRHVSLFPTLSLLAEQQIELGAVEKATETIKEALSIRRSAKLAGWLEELSRGKTPTVGSDPDDLEESDSAEELIDSLQNESEPSLEEMPTPVGGAAVSFTPEGYQEPPRTEDEGPITPVSKATLTGASLDTVTDESGTVVAYGGATEVTRIPMAVGLSRRDEPPTEDEVTELLDEVKARFGEDRRARQDALFFLALLFPDGSELALKLWEEGLEHVFTEDFETLSSLETRARDGNATGLVLATLQRRLDDEISRYGEQATESIETLTRLAKAFESKGLFDEAYRRVMLTTEILRSWFGVRSRRLLEPLAALIRLSEKRDDVLTALEHLIERHRLLELGQSSPEELFSSRVALLPLRALLGQVDELMEEAGASQGELSSLSQVAASEFASVLLPTAVRLERLHWRVQEAVRLLEMALAAVPDHEVSLVCRLQVAFAECQARRDYRSQAETLRQRTLERVISLESEARAEILHEMAESCLRVRELQAAREIAERILEERIADGGRKDQWAGRSLLILAEADLRSYRLEGTETAIAMSRPSLEGSPYWSKALTLKLQSDFFLGREEEAYAALDNLSQNEVLGLKLRLAVWRGDAEEICAQLESEHLCALSMRWKGIERAPLDDAFGLLEFFARAGKVRWLQEGLSRLEPRLQALLPTDVRTARLNLLRALLLLWEGEWAQAEVLLQRALDILPADRVEIPEGLSVLVVRGNLIQALLAQGKIRPAESQAKLGASEAAELLGEEDIRSIAFRGNSAFCAEARGDLEDSMELLDDVLAPLQERLSETHVLLRDIYRGLSRAFKDDPESARLTAEEALRIDKECRGLSLHLLEDLHLLATIERVEDPAEAKNLLDTASELGAQILPAGHPYSERLQAELNSLSEELLVEVEDTEPALSEEPEPSLDGWEVVDGSSDDHSSIPDEEQEDSLEPVEESAELLFDSQEEYIEDSAFETPLVDFSGASDSSESDVEPADVVAEFVLSEDEIAEEAAELAFATDEPAEPAGFLFEDSPEERPEAELSPEPVVASVPSLSKAVGAVAYHAGPRVASPSVEMDIDFPPVPFRVPILSEVVESSAPEELKPEALQAEELVGLESESSSALSLEDAAGTGDDLGDPEMSLLPLAPVFFLPLPWKEAAEAPYDDDYRLIYERFQQAFEAEGDWRGAVEEAVSVVRLDATPSAGYVLFLIGAQLEKGGRLHSADLCLATASELLDTGSAFGAACHLAGRVAGRRGELHRALDYFERAAELADEQELAILKVDAAECHLGLGRPEEALIGFEEVFEYLSEVLPKVQSLAVQAKMAQIHLLVGDPDSSLTLAEDVLEQLSPSSDDTYRALGRILLSRAFARLGRHQLALDLAEQAWEGVKLWSAKLREERRVAISNLIDIYSIMGRYDQADSMIRESGLSGWGLAESELLLRAARVACARGKFETARNYLRLGQSFLTRFRSPALWRSAFLEVEAELALRLGDPSRADLLSRQALGLFEQEATGPVDRSRHVVRAARIAGALGDLTRARALAEEAYGLRDLHLGSNHPHTESVEGLSAVFEENTEEPV